jgi:hypothetical protein
MLTKITLGALGLSLAGLALIGWLYKNQIAETAKWESAHKVVVDENMKWQSELKDQKARLARMQSISTERERRRTALLRQNRTLQQHIMELSHAQPEIRTYLDQPIPADLLGSLRQYATTDGSAIDREGLPTTTLANPMPSADYPGK